MKKEQLERGNEIVKAIGRLSDDKEAIHMEITKCWNLAKYQDLTKEIMLANQKYFEGKILTLTSEFESL